MAAIPYLGWRDAGEEKGLAVPPKRVLEQARQFALPVPNVDLFLAFQRLLVCQGIDDIAQGKKALVDLDAFLHALALGPSALQPLAASQVHKTELGDNFLAFLSIAFAKQGLVQCYSEHSVGPAGDCVHEGGRSCAVLGPRPQLLHRLAGSLDFFLGERMNIYFSHH